MESLKDGGHDIVLREGLLGDAEECRLQDHRGELLDAFSKVASSTRNGLTTRRKHSSRGFQNGQGVSALKMIVSLKLTDEEGLVDKVNACLSDIRLQAVVRVTKNSIVNPRLMPEPTSISQHLHFTGH